MRCVLRAQNVYTFVAGAPPGVPDPTGEANSAPRSLTGFRGGSGGKGVGAERGGKGSEKWEER